MFYRAVLTTNIYSADLCNNHKCEGIQGEDSGTFGCVKVTSHKTDNEQALIHVQVFGN